MRHTSAVKLLAATTVAVLVPAVAASAHPGLRPAELAAGATTGTELVIPHGCGQEGGMPDDGDASPTVEVALQWPDGMQVDGLGVDGWEVAADGGVTTWTDAGGATTEPIVLPLEVTVDADVPAGDVHAAVYQECDNGESFRWEALPDEEGSPALHIAVQPAEAASEDGSSSTDDSSNDGQGDTATTVPTDPDGPIATDDTTSAPTDRVTEASTVDATTVATDAAPTDDGTSDATAAGDGTQAPRDGGVPNGLLFVLGAILFAGAAFLGFRGSKGSQATTGPDGGDQ